MKVVIVGAGWAGLAAAVHLVRRGHRPVLLEAGREPGGRARTVSWHGTAVDNGQHLLVGAYTTLLELLDILGMPESEVLLRQPLRIHNYAATERPLHLTLPTLPAPLHLLAALAVTRGLTARDRQAALRMGYRLWRSGFQIAEEKTVAGLLRDQGQTSRLIERLWAPLCLAALNTRIERASARIFLRVLRDTFLHRRHDSDFLFPRVGLGDLFPRPAATFVTRRGGEIHYSYRATALLQEGGRIVGVQTRDASFTADQVILATPPRVTARLLGSAKGAQGLAARINQLGSAPIVTVYFQYPEGVTLATPMVALADGPAQWLFDRRILGQPGLIAGVISGAGPHQELDRATLEERIRAQLARLFPTWPGPVRTKTIHEKDATFDCVAHVDTYRPGYRTDLSGLLLAGDYTNTGYPGTLEGALRSGLRCARSIAGDEA